jgi:hypothetical protein
MRMLPGHPILRVTTQTVSAVIITLDTIPVVLTRASLHSSVIAFYGHVT